MESYIWENPLSIITVNKTVAVNKVKLKVTSLTHDLLRDATRHYDERDEEVGDGERHEEVVGDGLQLALHSHGQTDENIPCDSSNNNRQQQQHVPTHLRLVAILVAGARGGARLHATGSDVGQQHAVIARKPR